MNIHRTIAENLECLRGDVIELVEDGTGNIIPPFACRFSPRDGELASIVDEAGNVHLLNVRRSGAKRLVSSFSAHQNAIFDIEWLDASHVITASGDLSLRLVDVERRRPIATFTGHRSSVKCVAVQPASDYVFVSGARDGSVRLWDVRICDGSVGLATQLPDRQRHATGNNVRIGSERRSMPSTNAGACAYATFAPRVTFEQLHAAAIRARLSVTPTRASSRSQRKSSALSRRASLSVATSNSSSANSVTSLLFLNETTLATCADSDSHIRIWDARSFPAAGAANRSTSTSGLKLRPKLCVPYVGTSRKRVGYSHLLSDSTRSHLFAVCSDSVVYDFDMLEVERNDMCCSLPFGDSSEPRQSAPTAIAYCAETMATSGSFYVRASLSSDDRLLAVGGQTRAAIYSRCPNSHSHPRSVVNTRSFNGNENRKFNSAVEMVSPIAVLGGFEQCEVSVAEWCPVGTQKLVTLADDGTIRVWRHNRREWRVPSVPPSSDSRRIASPRRHADLDFAGLACSYVMATHAQTTTSRRRTSVSVSSDGDKDASINSLLDDKRNHNVRCCDSHPLLMALRRREYGLHNHCCSAVQRRIYYQYDSNYGSQTVCTNMQLVRRFIVPLYRGDQIVNSACLNGAAAAVSVFSSPRKPPQGGGGKFLSPCTPIKMTPKKLQIKESPFKSGSAHRNDSGSASANDCSSLLRTPTLVSRMLFGPGPGPGADAGSARPDVPHLASLQQDCVDGRLVMSVSPINRTGFLLGESQPTLPIIGSTSARIESTYKMQKRARLDGHKVDEKPSQNTAPSNASVSAAIVRRGRPTKRKITDYFGSGS